MATDTLPAQLRKRDKERLQAYRDNLAFYQGDQWERATRRSTPRRLTFNYAETIVHKATAYLMSGRAVTVHPDQPTEAAAAVAQTTEDALRQAWEQNSLDELDFDTELDAAVLGDGAYKVTWDTTNKRVRVTSPDPSGIWVWTEPDDPAQLLRLASQYTIDHDAAVARYPDAALTTKAQHTITEEWTPTTLQVWLDDTPAVSQPNSYGFIPFVVFPNIRTPKQLWGRSDVAPMMAAQRELNRVATQLSRILELSGNPITVLENVTDSADIAVAPGAVWEMPAESKAYLLDLLQHGGVKLHMDCLEAVNRALHDISETPRSAFGGTQRDLSGVALTIELDPLIKKTNRKRLIRTGAYRRRNDMILALLNAFGGAALPPANHTITWGPLLPTDRSQTVADEVALISAAVHSRRRASDTIGGVDDPDAELQRWLDEARQIASGQPAP